MEPFRKCFGVLIMKPYEDTLNFEYGTSKFDFSHFQCPMVTHLKFEFFLNCFNIWFIWSQLFVFISCFWPHVSNKTFCKSLDWKLYVLAPKNKKGKVFSNVSFFITNHFTNLFIKLWNWCPQQHLISYSLVYCYGKLKNKTKLNRK